MGQLYAFRFAMNDLGGGVSRLSVFEKHKLPNLSTDSARNGTQKIWKSEHYKYCQVGSYRWSEEFEKKDLGQNKKYERTLVLCIFLRFFKSILLVQVGAALQKTWRDGREMENEMTWWFVNAENEERETLDEMEQRFQLNRKCALFALLKKREEIDERNDEDVAVEAGKWIRIESNASLVWAKAGLVREVLSPIWLIALQQSASFCSPRASRLLNGNTDITEKT